MRWLFSLVSISLVVPVPALAQDCYQRVAPSGSLLAARELNALLQSYSCVRLSGFEVRDVWSGPPAESKARTFECDNCTFKSIQIYRRDVQTAIRIEGTGTIIDALEIGHCFFANPVSFRGARIDSRLFIHASSFDGGLSFADSNIFALTSITNQTFIRGADFRRALFANGPPAGPLTYGRNDVGVTFDNVTVRDFADFSNTSMGARFALTNSFIIGPLSFREAGLLEPNGVSPRIESESSENPDVDLTHTYVAGPLLLAPRSEQRGSTIALRLSGTWFEDTDVRWSDVRNLLGLSKWNHAEALAILGRFQNVYRAAGRRDDLQALEPDFREISASTWWEYGWMKIESMLTGFGYSLIRIPLAILATIGVFFMAFMLKAYRSDLHFGFRRTVLFSMTFAFASFWGSRLYERLDRPDRTQFGHMLGSWLETAEVASVLLLALYTLLLSTYFGR